jgi:hypothetical protein
LLSFFDFRTQDLSKDDLNRRAIQRRAVEASVAVISHGVPRNADGSVDIDFGPGAPEAKVPNWMPIDPHRQLELLFRLYEPEKPVSDKTWTLPDAKKPATP